MKTDLFQSCGHCCVFQICWHIKCSTFTASSFRIWNSSTGIPSPPLALFAVMLSKARLTSRSASFSLWSTVWRKSIYQVQHEWHLCHLQSQLLCAPMGGFFVNVSSLLWDQCPGVWGWVIFSCMFVWVRNAHLLLQQVFHFAPPPPRQGTRGPFSQHPRPRLVLSLFLF